jgi:uncharacterized protein (TIGR02145 family)
MNQEMEIKGIKIGTQTWASKNLDVSIFRNGDLIPESKTDLEWIEAGRVGMPAWCYFNNDPENGKKYGKLYNWFAVNEQRGLAPEGWHVPSDMEWTTLTNYLGGEIGAAAKLKSTYVWNNPNNGATNISGFTALPGGRRDRDDGMFHGVGRYSHWWSSTGVNAFNAWGRYMGYDGISVSRLDLDKADGFSVRCLRD